MKKAIKIFIKSALVAIIIGIGYLNASLYYSPKFIEENGVEYNEDVYNQLNFLKAELQNGAGAEMQKMFPEGFVFINALYALSWCNLVYNLDRNSSKYKEGESQISWALNEINSQSAKMTFDKKLPLEYGAFYSGWSNYLLGNKLMLQSHNSRDSVEVKMFKKNCDRIATALSHSANPYLESYIGQAWPADIIVGVASLSIHDKMFDPLYQYQIDEWLIKVINRLDPETGLIPHSVNSINGETMEGARGSSQSLILHFLRDIDEDLSKKQFGIYKELFLDWRFGLPGIREYPKGQKGKGDIDSGPVILGIGGAASIVGQRTMGEYGNWEICEGLRNCLEAFGAAYTVNGKKKYIFGQLPMADAFIAWSNSLETNKEDMKVDSNWRVTFQLLSVLLIVVLGCALLKINN